MYQKYEKWKWKENPFTLKIDPKLFTGYEEQVRAILNHIENKHKFALITGNTGSGKTTFLKWLEMKAQKNSLYVSKPPKKPEEFLGIFLDTFPLSFWEKLFRGKPILHNLPNYMNKKLKDKQLIFLIDEAHETDKEILEWLRVLIDQIQNVSLVLAALPIMDQKLKELQTFEQRLTTRVSLTSLTKDEIRELIKKRIEDSGGEDIIPFTDDAIEKIYQRTGGFPREVIKFCDRLVNSALEKDTFSIDVDDIDEHKEMELPEIKTEEPKVTFMPKPPSEEQIRNLPYKQRKILELLNKKDWLTPSAIIDELDFKGYATRGHAVRSINNILHRLMMDGFVQREARGKAFMYALTPKLKTMFVES